MKHAKDFEGKRVRLRIDITTRGKDNYPAGTVMLATQYSNRRDYLCLQVLSNVGSGLNWRGVNRVHVKNVELVN